MWLASALTYPVGFIYDNETENPFVISSEILGLLSAVLYLIPAILILKPILSGNAPNKKGLILSLMGLGVLIHAVLLFRNIVISDGLNLNIINALSLTSFLMVLFLWIMSLKRPTESLGIAVLPISALTVYSTALFQPLKNTVNLEIQTHIFLSVTAYGLLGLAALQAILVAMQSRYLHNHKPGGFIRGLPPLSLMEELMFKMLSAGFILLTLSLVSGFVFLDDMFAQHLVHKTTLSIAAWASFGILLYGHWKHGWRGKRAVKWALWAFVLLILAYFGSKFVLEVIIGVPTTQ